MFCKCKVICSGCEYGPHTVSFQHFMHSNDFFLTKSSPSVLSYVSKFLVPFFPKSSGLILN